MAFDIEALLDLWTRLPVDPAEAAAVFRTLYTDPVIVNGATLGADDLVVRATRCSGPSPRSAGRCSTSATPATRWPWRSGSPDARSGRWGTAAGVLPPTGQDIALRVIDILTLTDGRISEITMVADELGALAAVGAARLIGDG